jgi:hypothetical protein
MTVLAEISDKNEQRGDFGVDGKFIKIDLEETVYKCVKWNHPTRDRAQWRTVLKLEIQICIS